VPNGPCKKPQLTNYDRVKPELGLLLTLKSQIVEILQTPR
jgi:hypothetical protein